MAIPNPNLMLKRAAAEEGSSLGPPPLSLANLLEERGPRPRIMRTTIKPYNFVSTNASSLYVFTRSVYVVSATFRQLLSLYEKNKVFLMLWSNVTRFLTTGREKGDRMDWGDLPLELWGEIGKRLSSRLDILRFRSVCKKWRSSLSFPTRIPLWVPPTPRDMGMGKVSSVITEVSIYRCRGVSGFLIFEGVDHGSKFYAHRVHHNFWGAKVRTVKFDRPMKSFMRRHWVDRLSFFAKAYHLRIALPCFDSHNTMVPGQWDFHYDWYAEKMVIISSNATDGVNPSYARLSDLAVVALLSAGSKKGRLALLKLEGSSQKWVWDTDFCDQVFEEISTYRGRLCTLDSLGRVFLMDYNSFQMTQLSPPWPLVCKMRKKYLFEACGNLYLADFSVVGNIVKYKLNLRLRKWLQAQVSLLYLAPYLVCQGRMVGV